MSRKLEKLDTPFRGPVRGTFTSSSLYTIITQGIQDYSVGNHSGFYIYRWSITLGPRVGTRFTCALARTTLTWSLYTTHKKQVVPRSLSITRRGSHEGSQAIISKPLRVVQKPPDSCPFYIAKVSQRQPLVIPTFTPPTLGPKPYTLNPKLGASKFWAQKLGGPGVPWSALPTSLALRFRI